MIDRAIKLPFNGPMCHGRGLSLAEDRLVAFTLDIFSYHLFYTEKEVSV